MQPRQSLETLSPALLSFLYSISPHLPARDRSLAVRVKGWRYKRCAGQEGGREFAPTAQKVPAVKRLQVGCLFGSPALLMIKILRCISLRPWFHCFSDCTTDCDTSKTNSERNPKKS